MRNNQFKYYKYPITPRRCETVQKWNGENMRKQPLAIGQAYHIYTKSIAGFKIFNSRNDYVRLIDLLSHYQVTEKRLRLSWMHRCGPETIAQNSNSQRPQKKRVQLIAYCIMPTHLHFFLRQTEERGISVFMNQVLNSYTRFFNTKYKRKGPLWEARFKNVLIETNEQALHLTRYIHLNPVTAFLVEKAGDWEFSSFREYVGQNGNEGLICDYHDIISDLPPEQYAKFVADQQEHQRMLAVYKKILIDECLHAPTHTYAV